MSQKKEQEAVSNVNGQLPSTSTQDGEAQRKFYRDLQKNEVRTLHYLGLPYVVLSWLPELKVMVPMSTSDYEESEGKGFALQLVFSCPPDYPLVRPKVVIGEKRNVPLCLEVCIQEEICQALHQHEGVQMIVPVVTRMQMLINSTMRRARNQHNHP